MRMAQVLTGPQKAAVLLLTLAEEHSEKLFSRLHEDEIKDVSVAMATLGPAEGAKLAWRPQTEVTVGEGEAATLFKLIDTLDEDDDVQTVWGNYEVSDEVMERLG